MYRFLKADIRPVQQPAQPPAAIRIRRKETMVVFSYFIIITNLVNKLK